MKKKFKFYRIKNKKSQIKCKEMVRLNMFKLSSELIKNKDNLKNAFVYITVFI